MSSWSESLGTCLELLDCLLTFAQTCSFAKSVGHCQSAFSTSKARQVARFLSLAVQRMTFLSRWSLLCIALEICRQTIPPAIAPT